MPADHHTVAGNFRNHTGGGNAERLGVAIDDSSLGKRKGRDRQAVNKEVFRKRCQTRDGSLHGQVGCAEDVNLIDFCDRGYADSEYNFGVRNQCLIIAFASQGGELLGVVEPNKPKIWWQHDGGGDHRSRQRSASCLVDSGDTINSLSVKTSLKPKGAGELLSGLSLDHTAILRHAG